METVDACLERVAEAVLAAGGELLITADHGNCELMVDPRTGEPHTAHTTNPVPIWWITRDARGRRLRDGGLADVAPTLLELLGLPGAGGDDREVAARPRALSFRAGGAAPAAPPRRSASRRAPGSRGG